MAVFPALIAKLGLPVIMGVVAGALAKIDHPAAREAAKALGQVDAALTGGVISAEQMAEANRHAEAMAQIRAREYDDALSEINQTIRTEVTSDDVYVRRMRPTFGYLMAVTWAAQMLGLGYIMTFRPEAAPAVLDSMDALSTIWAVGLSVLGIYVYKRSEEKKVLFRERADAPPPPVPEPAKSASTPPVPRRKPVYND